MRIAIIGATGMVGSRLVTEARSRGHAITPISRNPTDGLSVDITDTDQLERSISAADAVVLAVRPYTAFTTGVLHVTARIGAPLLVVGGAGPLRVPDASGLVLDDPRFVAEEWKDIARASVVQLDECRNHPNSRWAYLSPLNRPGFVRGSQVPRRRVPV
ncbi:NAD(P)-dependent oxidoreductase, partial [uncultured Corynebacterium sp.]|uniref:NAD(P)-dependent oxidoreductase n=1 Tax=uncultured Corynebacterium sp. TaxID=159447 RepID=UPI0026005A85